MPVIGGPRYSLLVAGMPAPVWEEAQDKQTDNEPILIRPSFQHNFKGRPSTLIIAIDEFNFENVMCTVLHAWEVSSAKTQMKLLK